MSGGWLGRIAFVSLVGLLAIAPACADGPGRAFKHLADQTVTSPDGQLRVEQYSRSIGDDVLHQFWTFDRKRRGTLLNRGEGSDLAWDYFFNLPVSRDMHRDPTDPYALNHAQAVLLRGLEENYAWMGQHWPDSRYLVISLSFDIQGQDKPSPWIEGWRCVYDMKTGNFSIPPDFAEHNAQALKQPDQSRR